MGRITGRTMETDSIDHLVAVGKMADDCVHVLPKGLVEELGGLDLADVDDCSKYTPEMFRYSLRAASEITGVEARVRAGFHRHRHAASWFSIRASTVAPARNKRRPFRASLPRRLVGGNTVRVCGMANTLKSNGRHPHRNAIMAPK